MVVCRRIGWRCGLTLITLLRSRYCRSEPRRFGFPEGDLQASRHFREAFIDRRAFRCVLARRLTIVSRDDFGGWRGAAALRVPSAVEFDSPAARVQTGVVPSLAGARRHAAGAAPACRTSAECFRVPRAPALSPAHAAETAAVPAAPATTRLLRLLVAEQSAPRISAGSGSRKIVVSHGAGTSLTIRASTTTSVGPPTITRCSTSATAADQDQLAPRIDFCIITYC